MKGVLRMGDPTDDYPPHKRTPQRRSFIRGGEGGGFIIRGGEIMCISLYIYIYICISLSLSLYIYIYIYNHISNHTIVIIYNMIRCGRRGPGPPGAALAALPRGGGFLLSLAGSQISLFSAHSLLLFVCMNPREPAATARRPLRVNVLARRAAERLVHQTVTCRRDGALNSDTQQQRSTQRAKIRDLRQRAIKVPSNPRPRHLPPNLEHSSISCCRQQNSQSSP